MAQSISELLYSQEKSIERFKDDGGDDKDKAIRVILQGQARILEAIQIAFVNLSRYRGNYIDDSLK